MSKSIYRIAIALVLGGLTSCGATPPPEPVQVQEPIPEPPLECLPGCAINDDDLCQTSGSLVDGSTVDQVSVDCDPRCCQPGANANLIDPDDDGIGGDADQCPTEPEDYDGFQDEDGCPEADNDGDGIEDAFDVCPLDAETKNGFQDDDGCAD